VLSTYASSLQTAENGFEEGIYANGALNTNVQIQTQQIMLSSALKATQSQSPDFCLCVVPSSRSVAPGGSVSYTVTGVFMGGFSSSVSLSATPSISGVTYSFSPTTISPSGNQSAFQVSTTQSVSRGTFNLTVTGSGGGITHRAFALLTIITPISLLSSVLLDAPAKSVYFIFPDWNTAHKKPAGVGYDGTVSDWTALGFLYGSLTNMPQVTAPDTNSTYIDPSTGAPKLRDSVIVLFGGPLVNAVVHYYEVSGIAPLHWGLVGGWTSGTEYYYNRNGQAVVSMTVQAIGGGTQDLTLYEAFTDQFGNTVIVFLGLGWKGTFIAGLYFKTVLSNPSVLSSLTDSWYFYYWNDKNGNGFPDWYEVNPTPVNHGN
jgi:hypothetical protein